ncbi:MAG: hypothetical protein QOH25_1232 [Acidobacteriota bacterium]|jgi:hypothetical protein|nr:hypothetical protein [Acidobacteriota bacterium]
MKYSASPPEIVGPSPLCLKETFHTLYTLDQYNGLGYLKLNAAGLDHRLIDLPDSPIFDWVARSKGGLVWDMLSRITGQARFRQILQNFTRRHASQAVTLDQFLRAIEEGAGQKLDWFDRQWLEQTGAPAWELTWKQEGGQLRGVITQPAPYYRVTLEVQIEESNQKAQLRTIEVSGPRTEFNWPVKLNVRSVALDPHFLVLHWTPDYLAEAAGLAGYTRGRFKLNENKLIEAGEEFRKALEKVTVPDLHSVRFLLENGLDIVYYNQKNWKEAQAHFEAALASPSRRADQIPFVYLRLARIARELKDDAALCRAVENLISADAVVGNSTGAANTVHAQFEKCRRAP